MTNIKTPDFTLAGSLLVAQFNEMVATATDLGLEGYKEVNRFATTEKGVERTKKLHEAIQARAEQNQARDQHAATVTDPEAVEAETGTHPWDQGDQSHKASPETNHTGNPAEVETEETEEELTRLPDESEEAYMARKATVKKSVKSKGGKQITKTAGKKAATKGGNSPRVKSSDGSTIREMTEAYNAQVPAARKAGLEWVKHHTSNFESKDKAKVALDKLKKALAKAAK